MIKEIFKILIKEVPILLIICLILIGIILGGLIEIIYYENTKLQFLF